MAVRTDAEHMKSALKLAKKAKDKTYPNPMVGAIITRGGKVIGKGYHRQAGGAHAEIKAIESVSGSCRNAVMYVTLEPCDHDGKTPPCTKAIIASGISQVYVAMKDPNPICAGRGIKRLRQAGIRVNLGSCEDEAKNLNRKYIKFITDKLPYVTIKLAESLDGKIAARNGSSKWISSEISRKFVRKIRSEFDAILVGSNTVRADDPFLLDEEKKGYDTARIVADSRLKISLSSNLIKTAGKSRVFIGTTELADKRKIEKLRKVNGVSVFVIKSKKGKVALKPFLKRLYKIGMVNILVEGGGRIAGGLIDESLADEVMFFISPKIIGGDGYSSVAGFGAKNVRAARPVTNVKVRRMGEDIFVKGYL
ncbi:MAG: bifunctional diaminohydroxyphosphoribosylaminopyrimidine deaminase/5-amino-6-(5-phosphoribosylamino)uracil reductase RibD [Candidatus Omnitrophica bacterium]|nr:bifunctional diaminohydroxyphosphoribosylaminopyrimidine deaminase/5-amino-6-(5-phosphoribosylamino)uracil reductase RibD [Candidatus Omnitrophota bacterium]